MSADQNGPNGQNDDERGLDPTVREMREQIRLLQEEARLLQEQAREQRDRSEHDRHRGRDREERDREREDRRDVRDASRGRGRGERDGRREHRGPGPGFSAPSIPPMPKLPPIPPMPPLPPIPGAGGTFTPFDFLGLGGLFGAPPPKRRGRGRAGRGDVRLTILLLLAHSPANGYQLMQEIEQRTGGAWKPSSGSIYPALQQLEDEGIVTTTEGEGRKMFALTEEGEAYVREHRDEWTPPWETGTPDEDEGANEEAVRIRDLVAQLAMAYMQVIQVGTESQRAEAARVLTGARQALYRILAGDTGEE